MADELTLPNNENKKEVNITLPTYMHYVAISGVIGTGKTTLTEHFGRRFNAFPEYERLDENPFLGSFYDDRERWGLHTQLSFLASRFKQQQNLINRDLFRNVVVTDYMFDKDPIFASINVKGNDYELYKTLFDLMRPAVPTPDLIVYLQSSTDRLMHNIKKRGRDVEKSITREYIEELNQAYDNFFFKYVGSPVLIVNVSEIDFVETESYMEEIFHAIAAGKHTGTTYLNIRGTGNVDGQLPLEIE